MSSTKSTAAQSLLIDTDVLIDYLRGRSQAVVYLEDLTVSFAMSVITLAELYAGVRESDEHRKLDLFASAFTIVPLDADIALAGGIFRRDYAKSHNVGLADALIAATAVLRDYKLITLNVKHFPMIIDVITPYDKD